MTLFDQEPERPVCFDSIVCPQQDRFANTVIVITEFQVFSESLLETATTIVLDLQ